MDAGLATGSDDRTARLWDLDDDNVEQSAKILSGHIGNIEVISFAPNNRWMFTGNSNSDARVWDLQATKVSHSAREIDGRLVHNITEATVTPDSRWWITLGRQTNSVRLWDLNSEGFLGSSIALRGHNDEVGTTCMDPTGRWLATGSRDGDGSYLGSRLEECTLGICASRHKIAQACDQ